MEMTSNCDVTKSAQQIQMTTIWPWTKPSHENFLRTPLYPGNQSQFARRRSWQGRYGREHCGIREGRSTLLLNAPVLRWLFAELLLQHPNRSQQASSRVRSVMSPSCEVTQGVSNTWATCLTLLRGIWAQGRKAGFRCCGWLLAHVWLPSCWCRQPDFILITSNLTFSIQSPSAPVYHVLRTGRFTRVHWHLGAKLFLVFWFLLMCSSTLNSF